MFSTIMYIYTDAIYYVVITFYYDVTDSNERGQSKMNSARFRYSNEFECLLTVALASVFVITGAHGNPMVCRTTYLMGRFSMSRVTSL